MEDETRRGPQTDGRRQTSAVFGAGSAEDSLARLGALSGGKQKHPVIILGEGGQVNFTRLDFWKAFTSRNRSVLGRRIKVI